MVVLQSALSIWTDYKVIYLVCLVSVQCLPSNITKDQGQTYFALKMHQVERYEAFTVQMKTLVRNEFLSIAKQSLSAAQSTTKCSIGRYGWTERSSVANERTVCTFVC